MGGFVGDIFDSVTDAFEDIVDIVSDAANDMIKVVEDATKIIADITMSVTGIKWLDEQLTGGLIYNTVIGTIDNLSGVAKGVVSGDWVQIRNGALGILTTVVAVSAILFGAALTPLNPAIGGLIIASGITVLDAQYNEGEMLRRAIAITAYIETAVTGTHYIEEYAAEIQMLTTLAASIGAASVGMPFLVDISGVSTLTAQWAAELEMMRQVVGAGYGVYQVYSAIASIRASQAYWEEQLREYEKQLREWIAKAEAARNQWFEMMTNPDLINRIMPGGDLYSMGAGHDMFSVTSVAEPRFALGIIDESDSEMDRLMNNRYFIQYAGNDAFKPQ